MRSRFDRRVVPEDALELVRACQRVVPCHLGGGSVLSGAWLAHRLSRDLDLFCHDRDMHRELVAALPAIAAEIGVEAKIQRDSQTFVRAELVLGAREMELDLVFEQMADILPPETVEGIEVESPVDLRASKLTCILSRSEPRDLVDLMFLEQAGFPVPADLPLALKKDGGTDPGVIAWLLSTFPIEPLPTMLEPLTADDLRAFRDDLASRMRALALPA